MRKEDQVVKAVIRLDVPDWQIGQEVSVYFKDTMMKHGICENGSAKAKYNSRSCWYECSDCHHTMTSAMHCRGELIPAYKVKFCANCGKSIEWE